MHTKTSNLAISALIAAAYAALTLACAPISFGAVQLRLSEALCVLPFLFPQAIAGLTVGCFLANLAGLPLGLTVPPDLLLGTLGTLLGALGTRAVRRPALAPLPPVISNTLLVGGTLALFVLPRGSGLAAALYALLTVGLGELAACVLGGGVLLLAFRRSAGLRRLVERYGNPRI